MGSFRHTTEAPDATDQEKAMYAAADVNGRNIFTKHGLVSRYKTVQAFITANK